MSSRESSRKELKREHLRDQCLKGILLEEEESEPCPVGRRGLFNHTLKMT